MRNPTLLIAVALGLCGSAWLTLRAAPDRIDVAIATSRDDLRVSVREGVASVDRATDASGELSVLSDPGQPELPMRLVNVLLPPGRRVEDVVATADHATVLATDVTVRRAEAPEAAPDAEAPAAAPLQSFVTTGANDGTYPSQFARYLGSGTWHGYTIASFAVFPVRVEGTRVVLYEDIALSVETAATEVAPAARARRGTARAVENIQASVRNS